MASFGGSVVNNQIVLKSAVSIPGDASSAVPTYDSLFDTGAQCSLISPKVVEEVGLTSIGDIEITPASGTPIQSLRFRVRIDIPISSQFQTPDGKEQIETTLRGVNNIEAALFPDNYRPASHDVLLGMDFLTCLHFTMFRGNFVLSI